MILDGSFDAPGNGEAQCLACNMRQSSFCSTVFEESSADLGSGLQRISRTFHQAADGRTLSSPRMTSQEVLILCAGWAFRYYQLADGRRQILSILIPGDLVHPLAAFERSPNYSVQALTDVRYCRLDGVDLKRELLANPVLFDVLGRIGADEADDLLAMSAELAWGNAEDRIFHFALRLASRLSARGMVIEENRYPFPLSNAIVADITGLTEADVCQVVINLRKKGAIDVSDGELLILNQAWVETSLL